MTIVGLDLYLTTFQFRTSNLDKQTNPRPHLLEESLSHKRIFDGHRTCSLSNERLYVCMCWGCGHWRMTGVVTAGR